MHCVKSVRIRNFSSPLFPAFGMHKERYSLSLRIQPKCGKIRTRKTPNKNAFYAVMLLLLNIKCLEDSVFRKLLTRNFWETYRNFCSKQIVATKIKCSGPYQTSMLTIFVKKNSIVDAWNGPKYTCLQYQEIFQNVTICKMVIQLNSSFFDDSIQICGNQELNRCK